MQPGTGGVAPLDLADRARAAATKFKPLDWLSGVSGKTVEDFKPVIRVLFLWTRERVLPQCGFQSAANRDGRSMTIDDEKRKLEVIVETARKVWG